MGQLHPGRTSGPAELDLPDRPGGEVRARPPQRSDQAGVRGRRDRVGGIQKGQEFTAGQPCAGVAGRRETGMGVLDQLDPFVLGRHRPRHLDRLVGGAVVDDDHLELPEGLLPQAVETAVE